MNAMVFTKIHGVNKYDFEAVLTAVNTNDIDMVQFICANRKQLDWHRDLIINGIKTVNIRGIKLPLIMVGDIEESKLMYKFVPVNGKVHMFEEDYDYPSTSFGSVKTKWTGFIEEPGLSFGVTEPDTLDTMEITGPYFMTIFNPIKGVYETR